MDVRVPKVAVLKAATVAMVGFAMVCGLLILFGSMSGVAEAAPLAAGPTVITQDITIDTTWVVTDSPYIVSTDTVAVRNDSQLTIEPGVEVRFQSGAQLQLLDGGHLRAIGTTSQPITFTSNSLAPARGDWNGIRFNVDSLTGTIQYAVIEYGQIGFELSRPGQYYNVSTSTFRYIGTGNPDTSGAIIGVPDSSEFNYNTVYSSEIGFRLNKAFNNTFQGNEIYDIDTHCIALLSAGAGSPGGGENDFIDNQLHDCGANGIRLEGSGVSDNQIVGNVIWNTNNEGVYVANQSNLQFQSNTVYGTAFTTTTGAGSVGSNLGGVALIGVNGIIARDNYLHSNGAAASASYEGAFYIEDASGAGAMVITGSRVLDSNGSGLVFEGTIGPSSHTINNNAICVVPRYEVENRDGALTVSGNWLGTNSPAAGTEYTGTLTVLPTIQLDVTPASASILADGVSTTMLTVTFRDTAGHVVPPSARDISLATSAGSLSTSMVTVNGSGQASLVLTSTSSPATAVISATDSCGYTVTDTVTFAGYVDLGVSKTASGPPYSPGDLITYTISYANAGNVAANGVVLTETLPTSTTFVSPPGWTQVGSSNQYTYAVGSLAPASGPFNVNLVVRIDPALPAGDFSFTNTVRIGDNGASGADYNPADNIYTLTVSGGNLPDLWVVKNDNVSGSGLSGAAVGALANSPGGPNILQTIHILDGIGAAAVTEGELITYTIGYGNSSQGTAPATGVVLSETLPLYTSYAGPACGLPHGWCQVGSSRTYTHWIGGPLNPIMGDYVYFTVRVGSSLPSTVTEVVNTVCIYGNESDLLPGNNCSTEETEVITGTYDLSVTKVENATCLNPGDALNYQITVRNQGGNDASNVIVREILPANTTAINPPGSGWTDAGGGVYTYSLGLVSSGTITTVPFWVQIDPALPPTVEAITNTVSVQAAGSDSDPSNNSYTLVTPIGTTPDLVVTKNDNTSSDVEPGDVITYTIGFVNNSHRYTATNVVITDTLPQGTVITGASAAQWNQVGSSNRYTRSVGTLGPNGAGSVQLVVQIGDTTPYPYGSEVVNQVEIRGAEDECNFSNNTATEETPVLGATGVDLEVSKVDDVPFCAVPGDVIQYTIAYTNNSYFNPASNVVLTEMIDTGAVNFLGPSGWTGGGATYTRDVTSSLAARGSGTAPFNVEIDSGIPPGQVYITNVVRIGTTSSDWNPSNNIFTLTTYVPEWPDLFVIKNDNISSMGMSAMGEMDDILSRLEFSPEALALLQSSRLSGGVGMMAESVDPGGVITYTIILGNIGRATANGVVLTDTLPAGTTFVGPGYWHQVGSSRTYTYAYGSLDDGFGDVLQFIVQVDDPFAAGTDVINVVQIGGLEDECNTSNNRSTEETPVTGAVGGGGPLYLPIILKNYPGTVPTPTPTPTPIPTPTVPVPDAESHVADVAVDPRTHYVYVASPRDAQVHVINGDTYAYTLDVGVSSGPTGLGVYPTTNPSRIFVAHAFASDFWANGLRVFEVPAGPANLVGPQFGYVGTAPFKVAVNPDIGRAYVSNYYDNLAVIDTTSNTRLGWVSQKNYVGGWGIDVSTDTHRVYLATRDTGELVAFDGSGDRLLQSGYIPTHFKPPETCALYTVAVNETTDHIFVPCPARRKVFIHEEGELEILAEGELGTLELREDGWVRVMAPGDVSWLDSILLNSGAVSGYAGIWGITTDQTTNRVYVTDPENDVLIVIQDAALRSNMSVSYVADSSLDEPQGVAVDSARRRLFVANAGNDTVTVLEATSPFTRVTIIDLTP